MACGSVAAAGLAAEAEGVPVDAVCAVEDPDADGPPPDGAGLAWVDDGPDVAAEVDCPWLSDCPEPADPPAGAVTDPGSPAAVVATAPAGAGFVGSLGSAVTAPGGAPAGPAAPSAGTCPARVGSVGLPAGDARDSWV